MTTAADVLIDGQNVDKSLLRAVLAGYENNIASHTHEIQDLITDAGQVHAALTSLQQQINTHTSEITGLQTEITATVIANIVALQTRAASDEGIIGSLQTRASATEATVSTVQAEIAGADTHLASLDGIVVGLQSQINDRAADAVTLQTEINADNSRLGQHDATLTDVGGRVSALEASLKAAEAAFVSLSAIITGQETSGMGPITPVVYPGLNLFGAAWATDNPFGAGQSMSAGYAEPFASPVTGPAFGVTARVKTTVTSAAQIAVGQHELFWMGCDTAGHATAHFGTGGAAGTAPASYATITTSAFIADGAWHTLELDLTGVGAILFVDGHAAGTSDVTAHFYNAHPFGVRGLGGNRTLTPWAGKIAEVAVWGSQAKHTTDYTLATAPFTGGEGMTALYHLGGDGADTMSPVAVPIGVRPAVASGVRFFLTADDSVTYTVQPTGAGAQAAASNQVTVSGGANPDWYEPFTANLMLFVTGVKGAPLFRWLALPVIGQGGVDPSNLAGTATTTADAKPTVIDTILLTDPGIAASISGFVLARNAATGEAMSFSVSAVVKNIDTVNAAIDQASITAFSPPDSMAACALTLGVFGSTITLTATGLPNASVVWRPNLQTMVI